MLVELLYLFIHGHDFILVFLHLFKHFSQLLVLTQIYVLGVQLGVMVFLIILKSVFSIPLLPTLPVLFIILN